MHMHMLAFSYLIEQKLLCFGAMFCSNVLTVLQECCIWRPVLGSGRQGYTGDAGEATAGAAEGWPLGRYGVVFT